MQASLVDADTEARIRAFQDSNSEPRHLRWPILIAIGFGALALGAGVLLFVSAHWDQISPAERFSLVLLLVAGFHVAGAVFSARFAPLSTALHGVGTIALGAGIFLAAQIFNLQEHWPGGVLLWAIGAWIAWALRRDPVQATFVSLLTPAWLASEWISATDRYPWYAESVLAQGVFLLAVAYLGGYYREYRSPSRLSLAAIGGVALIPSATMAMPSLYPFYGMKMPTLLLYEGRAVAWILPLLLAFWWRRKHAWVIFVAALWLFVLTLLPHSLPNESTVYHLVRTLGPYIWYAVLSIGVVAWGLLEARVERVNLGVLGFGITVLTFYFSNVMDKLDRSASLIGLGLLFLSLGWFLERSRKRLVAKIRGVAA